MAEVHDLIEDTKDLSATVWAGVMSVADIETDRSFKLLQERVEAWVAGCGCEDRERWTAPEYGPRRRAIR